MVNAWIGKNIQLADTFQKAIARAILRVSARKRLHRDKQNTVDFRNDDVARRVRALTLVSTLGRLDRALNTMKYGSRKARDLEAPLLFLMAVDDDFHDALPLVQEYLFPRASQKPRSLRSEIGFSLEELKFDPLTSAYPALTIASTPTPNPMHTTVHHAARALRQPKLTDGVADPHYHEELLHYAYRGQEKIAVLGRDHEMQQLREFLVGDSHYLWVQLAGSAGQGKSRLAWELIQEARSNYDLDAGFMGAPELIAFREFWDIWQPDKPKLIVIDYAMEPNKHIGALMAMLMLRHAELDHRVRLLLIERQRWDRGAVVGMQPAAAAKWQPTKTGSFLKQHARSGIPFDSPRLGFTEADLRVSADHAAWFTNLRREVALLAQDHARQPEIRKLNLAAKKHRFGRESVIELSALHDADLVEIVARVAELIGQGGAKAYNDGFIRRALARFDNAGRPLYAYFLGLAIADGSFNTAWTKTELLTCTLTRYSERRWLKEAGGEAPSLTEDSPSILLAAAATITRSIPRANLSNWPTVQHIQSRDVERALVVVGAPTVQGFGGPGSVLAGMLPDLLGEWFVLRAFEGQAGRWQDVLSWCWNFAPVAVAAFLVRVAQDFPEDTMAIALLSAPLMVVDHDAVGALADVAADIVSALNTASVFCPNTISQALTIACDKGLPRAMFWRGRCHESGNGFEKSDEQAFYWCRQAADAGDLGAMLLLAHFYISGIGVPASSADGARSFQNAADAGSAYGMFAIGTCYGNGVGVTVDHEKAAYWYGRASESGNGDGMHALGYCYMAGRGVAIDPVKAADWYRRAAVAGNVDGKLALGHCYFEGRGVVANSIAAGNLYKQAAEAGHPGAMFALGYCYQQGSGFPVNLPEAVSLYREAAGLGEPYAMCNLGFCYQYGIGVTQDSKAALRWYQTAAETGLAEAIYNVGRACETGSGVSKNIGEAARMYRQAAEIGNVGARLHYVLLATLGIGNAEPFDGPDQALPLPVSLTESWEDGPPLRLDWESIGDTEASAIASALARAAWFEGRTGLFADVTLTALRSAKLACYPGFRLVDAQMRDKEGAVKLASALLTPRGAILLDGNPLRLEVVSSHNLELATSDAQEVYLKLRFMFGTGDRQPFHFIESLADIPLADGSDREELAKVASEFHSPQFVQSDGPICCTAKAWILTGNVLERVRFSIGRDGHVDAEDDAETVVIVPVKLRSYDGVFRTTPIAQEI